MSALRASPTLVAQQVCHAVYQNLTSKIVLSDDDARKDFNITTTTVGPVKWMSPEQVALFLLLEAALHSTR
jgi:hypothetical protein